MAWELIDDAVNSIDATDWIPVPHLLRHDYESLFYVSFWSVTAIPSPNNPKQKKTLEHFAKEFDGSSLTALSNAKQKCLSNPLNANLLEASSAAEGLRKWFWSFNLVLREGLRVHQDYGGQLLMADTPEEKAAIKASFDLTTLNGRITKDELKANLAPCVPGQSLPSVQIDSAEPKLELAEFVPVPAAAAASKTVEPTETVDGKQNSETPHIETDPGRAKDDRRDRRRNVRKNRMTVDQAMAAEQYRNTRLRPRKPRVYY